MKASVGSKPRVRDPARMAKRHHTHLHGQRMREVPNVEVDDEFEAGPEASAIDVLGAEFCHRIVRDLADGGNDDGAEVDGYDPTDWLQSEADGAHLLQTPRH
jgi:hypothetical protein